MPRVNQIIKRVFADLPRGSAKSKTAAEDFLNLDDQLGLQVTASQAAMKDRYDALSKEADFVEVLDTLASLEEIIIQMRAKLVIESELRLSLSRHYIYARTIFFRRGSEINDIRVLVGTTDIWGSDINALVNNPEFRELAKVQLFKAMDKEIEKNVFNLKLVYTND
jgi:hypothetical protein